MPRRRILYLALFGIAIVALGLVVLDSWQVDEIADASAVADYDSSNIHLSGSITPTDARPYSGFWKTNCSDGFGLAVSPATANEYAVSFCGPGGCFKPGTYRRNTPLVGDPQYRIESSPMRIFVVAKDGTYIEYRRCWPTPPRP